MGRSSASSEPNATRSKRYVSRPPSTPKYFNPATPAYCAGACTYLVRVYRVSIRVRVRLRVRVRVRVMVRSGLIRVKVRVVQ